MAAGSMTVYHWVEPTPKPQAVTHASQCETFDLLIRPRWLVPVEGEVSEGTGVALRDGRIERLVRREETVIASKVVELPNHALIPGLINTHTHAAMNLLKGLADDLALMTWLNEHIWPAESKWVRDAFVRDGVGLAVAEMIRGGTTCFNDMYFYPDETAKVAAAAGMRATVGLIVVDFPSAWATSPDEYLGKAAEVHDQFRNHPLINTAFAPHAPYTISDGPLERVRTLADELEIPIHIHVHETAAEVEQAMAQTGERPLRRLERLGLVSPRLLAVHMTQLLPEEIEYVAATGVHVVHCPESNLKLASGFCPTSALLDAGAKLCLGTDGAASNNDLSMLNEARTAALVGKALAADATKLPANQVLELATLAGARALGLDEQIGSIRPGKWADLVAVDLSAIQTQPVYDPVSALVYASSPEQVSHVWVAGHLLLNEGAFTTLDEAALRATANEWRQRIASGGVSPGG